MYIPTVRIGPSMNLFFVSSRKGRMCTVCTIANYQKLLGSRNLYTLLYSSSHYLLLCSTYVRYIFYMDYYCRSWYFYDFRSEHILGTAIKSNSYFTAFISSPTKYTANVYLVNGVFIGLFCNIVGKPCNNNNCFYLLE